MILSKVTELEDSPRSKPEPSDSKFMFFQYFMFQRSEKWENGLGWFGSYQQNILGINKSTQGSDVSGEEAQGWKPGEHQHLKYK